MNSEKYFLRVKQTYFKIKIRMEATKLGYLLQLIDLR